MPTLSLLERTNVTEAPRQLSGRRLLVQIINPGWGTSGYYSEAVLKQASADRVFPTGTHVYLDHPTETEKWERPARSVRDLAAVFASDARWDGSALVAEVYVFAPYRDVVLEMREAIGMSIRATCEAAHGKAEGRTGMIVHRFEESQSVDFVTKAGRGGRILQVLESARQDLVDAVEARNVGQWLESRLHQHFTNLTDDLAADGHLTREERIALSSAIGEALQAFAAKVEGDQPHLYERDPFADPTETAAAVSENVPATRSDGTTTTESQETQMGTKQIEESEYTRLTEAAGRVETLESELNTAKAKVTEAEQKATEAETARKAAETAVEEAKAQARPSLKVLQEGIEQRDATIARLVAENEARAVIAEALTDAWISDTTKVRLGTELLKALPLAEGKLDKPKLADRISTAVSEAETEAAELLKAAGVGSPRGLGGFTTPATEASTAKTSSDLEEAFQELGLSESAAKTAVKGR